MRSNNTQDILVRLAALNVRNKVKICALAITLRQCLMEFESNHGGFLCRKLGHFFALAQEERTFLAQHYVALFASVLHNAVALVRDSINCYGHPL